MTKQKLWYRNIGIALVNFCAVEHSPFWQKIRKVVLTKYLNTSCQGRIFIDQGFDCLYPQNIEFGDAVSLGHYNRIWAFAPVKVGKYVQTALGVTLVSGSHDTASYTSLPADAMAIEIGAGCWIGANVTILGGVKIGKGSIIAAGAVVTESMPEFSIIGGVPAKVIKPRIVAERIVNPFENYTIDELKLL